MQTLHKEDTQKGCCLNVHQESETQAIIECAFDPDRVSGGQTYCWDWPRRDWKSVCLAGRLTA